jgi:hypothetical protein
MEKHLYDMDLLYPTDNISELGSCRVIIDNPEESDNIPVIIDNKTDHDIRKYLKFVINSMQTDIFNRIFVNVEKNTTIYIKVNGVLKSDYKKDYIKAVFKDNSVEYVEVDKPII